MTQNGNDSPSPKEELVNELKKDFNAQEDMFALFANMFGIYLPRFKGKIRSLNAKAVERVLFALIEVPIAEKEFKPITKEEKEAFLIGESLLQAKMAMIQHTLIQHEKKKVTENAEENNVRNTDETKT